MKKTFINIKNLSNSPKKFRIGMEAGELSFLVENPQEVFAFENKITGGSPQYMIPVPGGNVFVCNRAKGSIDVIDGESGEIVTSIELGVFTFSGCYSPVNNRVYIGGITGGSLFVVNPDTNTLESTINVGSANYFMTYCPSNKMVYVVDADFNRIFAVDPVLNTAVASIDTVKGADPFHIIYAHGPDLLYVADFGGTLHVIDPKTNTLATDITITPDIRRIVYSPATNKVYVSGFSGNRVFVVDCNVNQVVKEIIVGQTPFEGVYCPDNESVYIPCITSGSIHVINKNDEVEAVIPSGAGARCCVYDPVSKNVFCSNSYAGTVSAVDITRNSFISTIPAQGGVLNTLYFNKKVYADNTGSGSVTIIESSPDMLFEISGEKISEPIVIDLLSIYSSDKSSFDNMLKKVNGEASEYDFPLQDKFTQSQIAGMGGVSIRGDEMGSAAFNEAVYFEWTIAGNSSADIDINYKEPDIKVSLGALARKRYNHGSFKYWFNR